MAVQCIEETLDLSGESLHIYQWSDSVLEEGVAPSYIFLLVHGLMMHGKSFDPMARQLVASGAYVVAPDIRGFGRFYYNDGQRRGEVDYKKSLDDLIELLRLLKIRYPAIPLVLVGESLGAHMVRRLVVMHPELVSGLILSSPCIRPRMVSLPLIPHTISELVATGLKLRKEVDLEPFARRFLENEPHNLKTYIEDPMNRKSLELSELLKSVLIVNAFELNSVSKQVPILVLRGRQDRVCNNKSTEKFLASLRSEEVSEHSFSECGHLILQSERIRNEVLNTVLNWTAEKCGKV